MNCESARKDLSLLLYGELSFDEEEAVQQHLDGCADCRVALAQERALHHALEDIALEPAPDLLHRCRVDLRTALRQEREPVRQSWWSRLASALRPPAMATAVWRTAGATALVVMGFFAGRQAWTPDNAARVGAYPDPSFARVRTIEPDGTGRVQLVVEETRQRTLSGRLEDEPIRRLLLAAAKDPSDPGLRVDSVDVLRRRPDSAEVRRALLYALQNDTNAGVRLKALEGLKPFASEPETRKALADVLLTDDNPGVRTQAIDLLIQNKEQDIVAVLQELLRKEDNNYVRLRSQRALREMGASVETF